MVAHTGSENEAGLVAFGSEVVAREPALID